MTNEITIGKARRPLNESEITGLNNKLIAALALIDELDAELDILHNKIMLCDNHKAIGVLDYIAGLIQKFREQQKAS